MVQSCSQFLGATPWTLPRTTPTRPPTTAPLTRCIASRSNGTFHAAHELALIGVLQQLRQIARHSLYQVAAGQKAGDQAGHAPVEHPSLCFMGVNVQPPVVNGKGPHNGRPAKWRLAGALPGPATRPSDRS